MIILIYTYCALAVLAGLCCIVAPYLVDNEACRPETQPNEETIEK